MTNKKPRGAPKKTEIASARIEFRCLDAEKARWESKAAKAGYSSLSAWLKYLADASKVREGAPPPPPPPPPIRMVNEDFP